MALLFFSIYECLAAYGLHIWKVGRKERLSLELQHQNPNKKRERNVAAGIVNGALRLGPSLNIFVGQLSSPCLVLLYFFVSASTREKQYRGNIYSQPFRQITAPPSEITIIIVTIYLRHVHVL